MPQLNPEMIPRVDLDFMNDDHQEAVVLINALLASIEAKDTDRVTELFTDFFNHNSEHFAREEEQMLRFNFPPYECHKGEHERVIAELQRELSHWQQTNDLNHIKRYVSETIISWFHNHVNTMDTVTASFIRRFQGAELHKH